MTTLKELYYDPLTGFVNANKLHIKAKKAGLTYTIAQVRDWLSKQFTVQVHKRQVKPKIYKTILSPEYGNNYQIDLLNYDRYEFGKYRYMLVVIDVYSRFLSVKPLTTRKFGTIMNKLDEICDEMGYPKNINCDNEFNTHEFRKWCEKYDVTAWFSEPDDINKNSIVERVNRTLAGLMKKYRTATRDRNWVKVLPLIVKNYNSTYHSTVKAMPLEIKNGVKKNRQVRISISSSLDVGDLVRIKRVKQIFDKGDVIMYSKKVYVVNSVKKNRYELRDSETGDIKSRLYKDEELKRVEEYEDDYEKEGEGDEQIPLGEGVTQEPDHTIFRPERTKKRVERFRIERVEPKKRSVKKFDLEKSGIYEVDHEKEEEEREGGD